MISETESFRLKRETKPNFWAICYKNSSNSYTSFPPINNWIPSCCQKENELGDKFVAEQSFILKKDDMTKRKPRIINQTGNGCRHFLHLLNCCRKSNLAGWVFQNLKPLKLLSYFEKWVLLELLRVCTWLTRHLLQSLMNKRTCCTCYQV